MSAFTFAFASLPAMLTASVVTPPAPVPSPLLSLFTPFAVLHSGFSARVLRADKHPEAEDENEGQQQTYSLGHNIFSLIHQS